MLCRCGRHASGREFAEFTAHRFALIRCRTLRDYSISLPNMNDRAARLSRKLRLRVVPFLEWHSHKEIKNWLRPLQLALSPSPPPTGGASSRARKGHSGRQASAKLFNNLLLAKPQRACQSRRAKNSNQKLCGPLYLIATAHWTLNCPHLNRKLYRGSTLCDANSAIAVAAQVS
jgi:hypothetical protein